MKEIVKIVNNVVDILMNPTKILLKLLFLCFKYPNSKIRSPYISINAKLSRNTIIGKNTIVMVDAKIGANVIIYDNVTINKNVVIGNYTSINQGTIVDSGKIGSYCSIGPNCHIGAGNHASKYLSTSQWLYDQENIFNVKPYWNSFSKPPIIGNDVWVGSKVVILQGIEVGDGAIIASGCVVTKDVPSYSIVGGVPGKVIKYRFPIEQIEALKELRWWNLDLDQLVSMKEIFLAAEGWYNKMKNL